MAKISIPLLICGLFIVQLGAQSSARALTQAQSWTDRFHFSGDFKYRHNNFYTKSTGSFLYNHQFRARLTTRARLNERFKVFVGLASGFDTPSDNFQTTGRGYSTKTIGLDLAFLDWKVFAMPQLDIRLGKQTNPFYRAGQNELMWDEDLRPEGITLTYGQPWNNFDVEFDLALHWPKGGNDDANGQLVAFQTSAENKLSPETSLSFGLGYFHYIDLKNSGTIYTTLNSSGNSTNGSGLYLRHFNVLELGGDFTHVFFSKPMTYYVTLIKNIASSAESVGWIAGVSWGKLKDNLSFQIGLGYRHLEADATIGAFTDSDFNSGTANTKGAQLDFTMQFPDQIRGNIEYALIAPTTTSGYSSHSIQIGAALDF